MRVSLTGEDVRLLLSTTDTILQAKSKLQVTRNIPTHFHVAEKMTPSSRSYQHYLPPSPHHPVNCQNSHPSPAIQVTASPSLPSGFQATAISGDMAADQPKGRRLSDSYCNSTNMSVFVVSSKFRLQTPQQSSHPSDYYQLSGACV